MKPNEEKGKKSVKKYVSVEEAETNFSKLEEPAAIYERRLFSYADYLTWQGDEMKEIINGMVYAFSAPLREHASAVISFLRKVLPFTGSCQKEKGKCKIYTAPFDVRLPKNGETADNKIYNVVQPDICVVCDESKLDEKGCIGAPDLIVEVYSPSTGKRDLNEKYFLYESSGVNEYWVVYPEAKAVTVFLLQPNRKYGDGTTYEVVRGQTQVPVQTLEGLIIDLEELFED